MPSAASEIAPSRTPACAFRELDVARLVNDLPTPFSILPRGTEGTVLLVFGGGVAYQVEFDRPDSMPETVPAALLESVDVRAA
jgi:hypothetical protein